MKYKFFLFIILIFLFSGFVSAITTISPNSVYPGETISLTIKPSKQGFYNIIYVMKGDETVDLINVPCDTICTKRQVISYMVPVGFLGDYYFATFDYEINDYEFDSFSVLDPDSGGGDIGDPSSSLTIEEIRNSVSGTNFLIYPEQGKNASILINVLINLKTCDQYSPIAYLCDSSIGSCGESEYSYAVPLPFVSRQGNKCIFSYVGEDYFPFYQPADTWIIYVKASELENAETFFYTELRAIDYPSSINFGKLNANLWNTGVPSNQTLELINAGNLKTMLEWSSDGFACISENCTDFWKTTYETEDTFQIDDDLLFAEQTETGLNPVFITNYSDDYFPDTNLSVCISSSCSDNVGERVATIFNLKLPNIQRGVYQGDIGITLG